MTQVLKCPSCGAALEYGPDPAIGCAFCGNTVIVPPELRAQASDDVPPSAASAAPAFDQRQALGEIAQLARSGNKIAAIKRYREITGLGLKESKDAVERIVDGERVEIVPISRVQPKFPAPADRAAQIAHIGRLLSGGNKIEAIKAYRETFGVGLKEAKEAVDLLETTVGTPGAFDLHPDDEAPDGVFLREVHPALPPARPSRPPTLGCRGGLSLTLAAIAIPIVVTAIVLFAGGGDNRLAVSIRRMFGTATPVSTPIPPPTPAPTLVPSTATPEPFAQSDVLVDCSGSERGCFEDARHMGLDGAGNLYVGEYAGGRVQVFDPSGAFVRQWWLDSRDDHVLSALAVDPQGIVYAVSGGQIYRYDGADGTPLGRLEYDGGPGFQDVAVAPGGRLVAAWNRDWQGGIFIDFDESQDDLVVFDSAGQVEHVFPKALSEIAGGDAELDTYLAVDRQGNIYATGLLNPAVHKFTPDGRFVDRFGQGEISYATALAVDEQGRVCVSSFGQILIFDANGHLVERIDEAADDMAFDAQNELLVLNDPQVIRLHLRWGSRE